MSNTAAEEGGLLRRRPEADDELSDLKAGIDALHGEMREDKMEAVPKQGESVYELKATIAQLRDEIKFLDAESKDCNKGIQEVLIDYNECTHNLSACRSEASDLKAEHQNDNILPESRQESEPVIPIPQRVFETPEKPKTKQQLREFFSKLGGAGFYAHGKAPSDEDLENIWAGFPDGPAADVLMRGAHYDDKGAQEFAKYTHPRLLEPFRKGLLEGKSPGARTCLLNEKDCRALLKQEPGIVLWPNQKTMPPEATDLTEAQQHYQQKFHFVISTECHTHHDWQSLGNAFATRRFQPYSNYTRLIACPLKQGIESGGNQYTDPKVRGLAQSFVTPMFNPHPETGDEYPPYAKSASLVEWMKTAQPREEIIVSMDPDMIILRPIDLDIDPEKLRGRPIAMGYELGIGDLVKLIAMPGMCKECQARKLSDEELRSNGRAGAPYIWHRDDLATLAPLWKLYTERIRNNKEARELIGWLADMYSYALASIHLQLTHELRFGLMVSHIHEDAWEEGFESELGWDQKVGGWKFKPPFVFHYCQWYTVGTGADAYVFDKHTHALHMSDALLGGRRFPPVPKELDTKLFESDLSREWDAPNGGTLDECRRSRWLMQMLTDLINGAFEWHDRARFSTSQIQTLKEDQQWWGSYTMVRPMCTSSECWSSFCHGKRDSCYEMYSPFSTYIAEKFNQLESASDPQFQFD
jgi:hypothetical protein